MYILYYCTCKQTLNQHAISSSCDCWYSVALRTTPRDSTGIPHILEHLSLCGSTKYPVRDPFFKMLTRSLSTFMNAFTGMCIIDSTLYKCSRLLSRDVMKVKIRLRPDLPLKSSKIRLRPDLEIANLVQPYKIIEYLILAFKILITVEHCVDVAFDDVFDQPVTGQCIHSPLRTIKIITTSCLFIWMLFSLLCYVILTSGQ